MIFQSHWDPLYFISAILVEKKLWASSDAVDYVMPAEIDLVAGNISLL